MAVLHELKPKPSADLLEMIDNLRRDIETGEVSGFAFAVVNRDGGGATGWHHGGVGAALNGMVARIAYRMNIVWDREG